MKILAAIGIILIVIGLAGLVVQGVAYTSREKVVDIGPLHISADKTRTIPVAPIVGVIVIAGGIALLVVGLKKG